MKPELIWTRKVCETCLGTKGRLSGWERAKGISFSSHRLPCVFLIDRPQPHLMEMTCSWQWALAFQVDHLSAGKLSSLQFITREREREKKKNMRQTLFTLDDTCMVKLFHSRSADRRPQLVNNVCRDLYSSTRCVLSICNKSWELSGLLLKF